MADGTPPLHDSDKLQSPEYLRGRQDGLVYAALIIDATMQKHPDMGVEAKARLTALSNGLKFGTMMLDLTGGVMPPRTPKDDQ